MFSMDAILLEFMSKNFMSITMLLLLLKGLSDISSWKWDNKVVALLTSMLNGVRSTKKGDK